MDHQQEPQLTDSSLSLTTTSTDLQKAWYLLYLIIRLGHPIPNSSLVSFTAFRDLLYQVFRYTPQYITHLCSIPNSPIVLTDDLSVAPSLVSFRDLLYRFFAPNGNEYEIALSSQYITHLCSIPNSPIVLTDDLSVAPSLVSFAAFRDRFFAPRVEDRVFCCSLPNSPIVLTDDLSVPPSLVAFGAFRDLLYRLFAPRVEDRVFCFATLRKRKRLSMELEDGLILKRRSNDNEENHVVADIARDDSGNLMKALLPGGDMTGGWSKMGSTGLELKASFSAITDVKVEELIRASPSYAANIFHTCPVDVSEVVDGKTVDMSEKDNNSIKSMIDNMFQALTSMEVEEQSKVLPVEVENASDDCKPSHAEVVEDVVNNCNRVNKLVGDLRHEEEHAIPARNSNDKAVLRDANGINSRIDLHPCNGGDTASGGLQYPDGLATYKLSVAHNQLSKVSVRANDHKKDVVYPGKQAWFDILENSRDKITSSKNKKVKQNREGVLLSMKDRDKLKKKQEKPVATCLQNQPERRPLPSFKLYCIEDEEGSGGYGTVYRARRKADGVTFAIKCPHENVNRLHLDNELKMLERFGGKNSIIKYEGSFESNGSECLVLEHVHHDRPEILKKEIEVTQLKWYGYCMFRALTTLHKQGIVHRDIKPGNFLFSRKLNQGFLIDFNLAQDLHQKYGTSDKSKFRPNVSSDYVPLVQAKTLPLAEKKFLMEKPTASTSKNAVKDKSQNLPKTQKKNVLGQKKTLSSKGPDVSGVTSAKDATSSRVPSGEILKEPIIVQGRKALVTFARKARESPDYEAQIVPASKRKRVSALPRKVDEEISKRKVDKEHVCFTPMPLFCNGMEVAGSGRIKDNEVIGDRKQKRDGPCVGTKGFRAPEVLFRSAHQGPKIDVWSAGVTLLYLMIGRTPFTGEPEQNIIDIAKLRGSEDLWEVAKLHNRVSSFPPELHDVKFLSPVKLKEWCKQNTRRPEFFKTIPLPLFDLVDKCLAVNPRLRLSAEEALRHLFFSDCHIELRKQRSKTSHLQGKELETLE